MEWFIQNNFNLIAFFKNHINRQKLRGLRAYSSLPAINIWAARRGGGGEVKLDPLIKNSWLSETIQYIELKFSDINNIPILLRTIKNTVGFHMTSLKFKLKKLSILPRFYFHDALQQLKTNFHTNFRFKRVLGFVIDYAWISKLLRDAAFTWRPKELSGRLRKSLFQEILLSKQFMY